MRAAAFDLSSLAQYINTNGTTIAYVNSDGSESEESIDPNGVVYNKTPAAYNISTPGEWATEFSYGTVKGVSACSTISGDYHSRQWGGNSADWKLAGDALTAGDYDDSDKRWCWCKVTGVDTTGNGTYQSVEGASWIYRGIGGGGFAYGCAADCSRYCAEYAEYYSGFRSALYGITQ